MGESSVDKINGAEKRIQHYSSSHKILLVGEGDFSFAACLAKAFGTAANMTATSFDSKGIVWDCNILPLPISLLSVGQHSFINLFFLYIHLFLSSSLFNTWYIYIYIYVCLHTFGLLSNWELFAMHTKELLMTEYSNAMSNLKELEERRCTVLHDVDARNMNRHPLLHFKLFDRITFNFPHAGFIWKEHDEYQIE
jgi:hypothetical protein